MKNLRFVVLLLTLFVACSKAPVSQSVDAGSIVHVGAINPVYSGDFSIYPGSISATTLSLKDTGSVIRDKFDLLHGRFQAGLGSPSGDALAMIGPMPGFETADSGLWLLTQNGPSLTPSSSNVDMYSDGVNLYLNRPVASSSYPINFSWAGGAGVFRFLYDGVNTATFTNQASTNITNFTIGTNNASGKINFQTGSAVTTASIDTHGRITAGGGGTDYKAVIGPYVSGETTAAAIYVLPGATAPSASNYLIYADTNNVEIHAPFSAVSLTVGAAFLLSAQASNVFIGGTTTAAPLFLNWATPTTPIIQGGTASTSLALGTNRAGATLSLQADAAANVMQLAGGTQNGIALGANLATVGHIRTPSGFQWLARNSTNGGNNSVLYDDGADSIYVGNSGYLNVYLNGQTSTGIMSGGTVHASAVAGGFNIGSAITFADTAFMNGAMQLTTISIAANRTLDTTTKDNVIIVDTSGGVVTVTLPTPTNGRCFTIIDKKNTFGTNNLTLARHAAEKINGVAASKVISANGYRGYIFSDGTDWYTQ